MGETATMQGKALLFGSQMVCLEVRPNAQEAVASVMVKNTGSRTQCKVCNELDWANAGDNASLCRYGIGNRRHEYALMNSMRTSRMADAGPVIYVIPAIARCRMCLTAYANQHRRSFAKPRCDATRL